MPSFTGTPRGRIVKTDTRRLKGLMGSEISGMKLPLIIVHVKNSKRFISQFEYISKKKGLAIKRVDDQFRAVYEVTGTPQALEEITGCPFILEWHFALNVGIAPGYMHRATGTGPEKRSKSGGKGFTQASPDGLGYPEHE